MVEFTPKTWLDISGRRVEVRVLEKVYDGVKVEAVREVRGTKTPTGRRVVLVGKGQLFTVRPDLIIRESVRDAYLRVRHQAYLRKQAERKREMPLNGPVSHSEAVSAETSGNQPTCPVCASQHATGACTITNVLDGK